MTNAEARFKELAEQLHKANMEINRLVIENNEQEFEIFRLKRLLNRMYGANEFPDLFMKEGERAYETGKLDSGKRSDLRGNAAMEGTP